MSDFGEVIDSETVRFERLLPGPIDRVWEYLTNPGRIATWLANAKLELRLGGSVELQMLPRDGAPQETGGAIIRGVVTRYEPPRVLAYTWRNSAPGATDPEAE